MNIQETKQSTCFTCIPAKIIYVCCMILLSAPALCSCSSQKKRTFPGDGVGGCCIDLCINPSNMAISSVLCTSPSSVLSMLKQSLESLSRPQSGKYFCLLGINPRSRDRVRFYNAKIMNYFPINSTIFDLV